MSERRVILRHAATVLIGQLAVMAFSITDTVIAGRFADTALAALAVASATYITVFISLMGVLQALLPIWSELHGASRQALVGQSLRQALYLVALLSAVGIGALLFPDFLLKWTQIPHELDDQVRQYLAIVALSLPASLLFRMFGTLNQSLGKPQWVTAVQVLALCVKIPLSLTWVLGIPGWLEPQGLVGCAWASFVVNHLMLGVAVWLLKTQDFYRPYLLWQSMEAPSLAHLSKFLKLGIPSGLAIGVEVTSFTLMSLFIARMGVQATASHQIASNMAAVLYMVPLALSIATSARVSFWLGAKQTRKTQQTLRTGLTLVLISACTLAALLGFFRLDIALLYTESLVVATLAGRILAWICLYHLADAIQVFCVFNLRSFGITVLPLLTYTVCLWGLGLAGGYAMAYSAEAMVGLSGLTERSPVAFWQASSIALCLTALVLGLTLWRAQKKSVQTNSL